MGQLQVLRAAFAVVVLASALFAENVVGAAITDLALVTASYLLLSASAEGLRRMGRGRGLGVVFGMLLVDGVYLAWAMYATGGTASPLRFLVYVHLIAVTLLASYRTGLKIALWHSILFFVVFYAQAAGILHAVDVPGSLAVSDPEFQQTAAYNVMAFWIVALVTAVFSSLNERELRRRRGDLEALAEMASRLETTHRPDEVAEALLDSLASRFDFKRGVVLGGPAGDLTLLAYRAPGEPGVLTTAVDSSIQAAWNKRDVVLKKQLDPDEDPNLSSLLPFARNLVVVPLTAEGGPVGIVAVEHSAAASARIERRVVEMVAQFTAHAALALHGSWLAEQVQRAADTDALTGIANRRTFEATLERELSRALRHGEQITLAMFDIDHFKSLNDNYGHQTGDDVLKKVAAALTAACRDFDLPARFGGEEFAVILPSCSTKESLTVAERLRQSIAKTEGPVEVTASAGVATFPTHAADAHALIKAADEALYESKRAGRDRVTRSRRRGRAKARAGTRGS